MVCQVALSDARIILPTVKNSGATVGRFACYQQNVVYKISSEFGVFFFYLIFVLCLFHSDCIIFILLYLLYFISNPWQQQKPTA